jgi:iron complex transport system substrate-binding protein|tara:strand:- start:11148 stop:12050 length:903 start_codon:yes stop_codon:yes gene_type:complete
MNPSFIPFYLSAGQNIAQAVVLVTLIFAVTCASDASAEIRVIDDLGEEVVLLKPARRVISLAPHITELIYSLGAEKQIVGTVKYSDYPPEASTLPRIGDAFSLNIESVLALKPDLIIAWHTGGNNRPIERLRSLGLPVYTNEAKSLAGIGEAIIDIAALLGKNERGFALQQEFVTALENSRVVKKSSPVIFFQISDQELYTVSSEHLIGQAINHCGGKNLFSDISPNVSQVNQEMILANQPDVIVVTQRPGSESAWVKTWRGFTGTQYQVDTIDPDLISRPSLRMLDGIKAICEIVNGAR